MVNILQVEHVIFSYPGTYLIIDYTYIAMIINRYIKYLLNVLISNVYMINMFVFSQNTKEFK